MGLRSRPRTDRHPLAVDLLHDPGHFFHEDRREAETRHSQGAVWHRFVAAACLAFLSIPGSSAGERIPARDVLADGTRSTERIGTSPGPDPAARSDPWYASVVPGKGPNPWPRVLDALSPLPLHVRPPNEFTATWLDEGRVDFLTGRTTNSAAIIFTALLKANAAGRMTQGGEEVSDNLRFWSEGGFVTAPASKLVLRYTDGYHDRADGCHDFSRRHWPVVLHGVAVGSLHPDFPVDLSVADYRAGRDPALEAALTDIRRRHARP
jgi:hypothetical protein